MSSTSEKIEVVYGIQVRWVRERIGKNGPIIGQNMGNIERTFKGALAHKQSKKLWKSILYLVTDSWEKGEDHET